MASEKLTIEQFIKARVRDWEVIRKASARIDAFRKKYGRSDPTFDSAMVLRKLRESR